MINKLKEIFIKANYEPIVILQTTLAGEEVDNGMGVEFSLPEYIIIFNGDDINNEWKIVNIDVFESCPIRIFNRRGQTVYEGSRYNNDWDGTLNGSDLPEGAYYYILSCSSSEVHTGSITLIR